MDVVTLSRIQFAVTIAYHFLFVPLSIGLALVVALFERRFYRSGKPEDRVASDLWIRIFTTTFAVGVATGLTMEFAFGTNWASYSRFVGDIFGAPLAAEGLFAFFLESIFLGVLLFGRSRVSKKFYYTSSWLVFGGSLLSALWIIIANSWMQTPAGYEIALTATGSKAVLTDFFAAAFNPSTVPRYLHTINAILVTGGFLAAAIGAYYLRRGEHREFGRAAVSVGLVIAAIASILMLPTGHYQAVEVINNQPAKIAAMEGHWETGPIPLGLLGYVDTTNKTTHAIEVPGGASFLATFNTSTSYPGLNDFAEQDWPPLQATYQTYHAMTLVFGALIVLSLGLWWLNRKGILEKTPWLLAVMMWLWVLPELGIQLGWAAAEIGRQPWIVYGLLRTSDAVSAVVPAGQVALTLGMFVVVYTFIYVAWARIVLRLLRKGPALTPVVAAEGEGSR